MCTLLKYTYIAIIIVTVQYNVMLYLKYEILYAIFFYKSSYS